MSLPSSVIEGKFEVLHKISEGGMGAVYKVHHLHFDQPFVIKVIRAQHQDDAELQERFRREAQAAVRLRHNNIAAVHDFSFGEDGTAYLVMEFIEGMTLKQVLAAQGPLPVALTSEIAVQSLRALSFLHRQGYLHRDISPDNLMLTRSLDDEPLVKLIDLGLAKRLEGDHQLTSTGMFLGKVRYSAPEQFKGLELDQRSDLYSFGIMLYEQLTGHLPIQGEDFSQFIAAHLFKAPLDFDESDPDGRIPPGLRRVVLRTLEKDRDDRVATADELAQLLAPFSQPDAGDAEEGSKTLALSKAALLKATPPPESAGESPRRGESAVPTEGMPSKDASVARVEAHLASRELDEATAALAAAESEHGADENTQELRTQLQQLRRKEREERLKGLLEKARRQLAVDEMTEALETLQEAQALDPQNVSVQALLAQVQTTVDRKRAAKPKGRRMIWRAGVAAAVLGLAAILVWVVFKPAAPIKVSAAQGSYDLALTAVENENWPLARQHLRRAIELDPNEKAEGPYLPQYLLGVVSERRFNCINALKEWEESERQGAIQQTPVYRELVDGRERCLAELSPRIRDVERALDNADQLAGPLRLAVETPDLFAGHPELLIEANTVLQELDDLYDQLDRAKSEQDFRLIDSLEAPAIEVERRLGELQDSLPGT